MTDSTQETKHIFCNQCNGETNHFLQSRHKRHRVVYEDGERYEPGEVETSVWSCAGCEEETFEWRYRPVDDDEVGPIYYPARSGESIYPKLFSNLNSELRRLYREVVTCFNEGCLLLCTIGLRALVEGICKDKGLSDGNLERKIDALTKFLPSVNLIQALHTFRFAGNNAAHDLDSLSRDEARIAIEVTEDLLNFLYDLDYKASHLRIKADKGAPKSGFVH